MEQAQYWLWMKRKQLLKSQLPASMKSMSGSWEEKAFTEDSSGHLGGSIWPPRSYSCSFCKREFRSAQALGGHMNVHRRDRARLKQSLSPHFYVFQHQNHIQSSLKSLGSHFPSDQVCTLDNYYDLDPKLSVSSATNIASTTLSSSRVSTLSNQENLSEHAFASPPSSSLVQEQHKGYPYLHNNLSGSDHSLSIRLRSKPEAERNQGEVNVTCLNHDKFVATDIFMGPGSAINTHSLSSPGSCGNEAISCKRPRTNVSVLSLLVKPRPSDRYNILQSGETRPDSSSNEGIDLELRLGETPEVIK
ncbi:hypothetical protein OIU76_012315 [Salix suchowensis]|uniref:C2H2-type domain-containing protein n=1 Tax=Salix suchowensis TaxID=1278906 RepID=A0ABQ8ZUC1_9ROSI|nr:zinc finger protein [Salix suchowensis]KAJ6311791.1 hypothetical protein OIU77_013526 [Salix suchowensis]KAJ6325203.1 hypothetical protein OIU76_012315 [Salix suchowensis]KAJ6357676.1 hypothetical protein OIU78_005509 [Salix suchowensis]